ncbi:renin receptor isoform X1 [Fopius arisanus]|uniref:Renin receptor isoform X1 n=1 Tax=Fopius arisanus TaxID=64838 RepID=A0A9R1TYK5_9HYME|nr:PREDICTED: renin receptor isoform X1 [Fopius arisanus]
MLKIVFLTLFAIGTALGDGELVILNNPASVHFDGTHTINQSCLKEVFTVVLGYTPKLTQPWDGVTITDPFALPEALVSIAIEGVETLKSPRGKHFPLNVDEVEETTWQAVSRRLEERDNNNTLVRICVGDGLDALGQSALGELKPNPVDASSLKHLSLSNDEDRKFIEELELLRAIAQKVPSTITANSKPDVYWFVVSGLRPVIDLHGKDSEATKEAFKLLNDAVNDVSNAFTDIYNGQVVVAVFTNDVRSIQSRVRREEKVGETENLEATSQNATDTLNKIDKSIRKMENDTEELVELINDLETTTRDSEKSTTESDLKERKHEIHSMHSSENDYDPGKPIKLRLSKRYSANYPVIFNIFLWFGVVFFFSLLAICIAIAQMDPGRDSIIYRMTSNRMKKDN